MRGSRERRLDLTNTEVSRPTYLAILFLALVASARAGIDFTPTAGERVLEGIVFKQIVFHQNGRPITYEQPRGWTFTGSAAAIKFSPPDVSQAQATMEQSPLPEPQVFDEATTARLREQVLTSVPNGAQNVALVGEENNPLPINQRETYAVTVSYDFYGEAYQASVLFVNLADTQLRFRTVARKADFEKVHRAFRASLFTLAWQ
ncbi:hypothetical protein BH20VER3_BH20VER3_15680 [soil metagenome]